MNLKQGLPIPLRWLILALTGATMAVSYAQAQMAPAAPAEATPTSAETPAPAVTTGSSDVVKLSPFEVKAGTVGYFAPNSTAGTRFNTPIEDLASSITVVTPAQMKDFAMLDINDVFLYTASTEGTGTYTDFTVDRNGSVSDNVSLDPNNANRIRGLSSSNIAFDNFDMTGRMPIDPTIIDGLEVSRGPNATIFGLGNPSGTINQVAATANMERNRAEVQARVDSFDGYRSSLDVNRVLLRDKLAVRVSGVFQRQGYVLKPSGTNTERYNAMIKYHPFKGTTISAGIYYYRMYGNRPNALPPRDNISYWIASGKPTWDPVTQTVHLNGATLGPYTASSKLPNYFIDTFTGSTHSQMFVNGDGSIGFWGAPQVTSSVSPIITDPKNKSYLGTNTYTGGTSRFVSTNSAANATLGRLSNQPLFTTTPSVSDKSIYDWSSINMAAINRIMDRDVLSEVKLDQFFFDTPLQSLVGQVAFMREDTQRYQRNLVNTANDNGQSGQLFVDVNERLLNGSPNPFFLRPYIGTDQPRTVWAPAKWDTYRAQLLYTLDLTGQQGWLKWLGRHQLAGYDEYKYQINRQYSYKDAIANNLAWIPAGTPRGNQGAISGGPIAAPNLTRNYYRYYVGGPGTTVQYAPANFSYGTYPYVWGGQGGVFNTDQADLEQVAVTDATGGGSNLKTILKTMGAVLQDHFLDDSIITTFGLREDKQYVKNGSTPQLLNADGTSFNYPSLNSWHLGDYGFNSGKTKTGELVLRPFKDLLRRKDTFWANALRGIGVTYNKSDSFIPQVPKIDLFQQSLPNTTGKDDEYGLWWNITDKLVVRLNHYDTKVLDNRNGDASTVAQRVARFDINNDKPYRLFTNVTDWVTTDPAHAGWTQAQITAEIAKELNLPDAIDPNVLYQEYTAGSIASTQDAEGKGWELEINYNPTNYLTVAASLTKGQDINTNYSQDIAQWIAQRMSVWTTIQDPRGADHVWGTADDGPVNWWNSTWAGQSQTPAQNYQQFVATPLALIQQLDGKSSPEVREYNARVSTSLNLAGITSHPIIRNFTVGGAVRWEDKGAIGYYGIADANGIYQTLDASRPIYDKAHFYVDMFLRYQTTLFGGRVPTSFQFNVKNLGDKVRLQAIGANPDGSIDSYRIMDPAQYIFTVTFDL
jgi:TonB-dependent Receptor Plug Domain